jgi:branched-chain amino acid transport system ATP-binding protein
MYFSLKKVSVNRGPIHVLKNLSMEVHEKEMVSAIGANGAGKTTLLWTIVGLLKANAGTIEFQGGEMTHLRPDEVLRRGIALCPAERHVFPRMTVLENLKLGAFLRNESREIMDDLEQVFRYFPRLEERKHQRGATLSGGEQQMLAMARSVMSRPKLLLLDEPSLGLAPILVKELGKLMKEINEDGTTLLLVEQNAMLALELSQRTYVIELGEIVLEGRSADIAKHERVKTAFLGEA